LSAQAGCPSYGRHLDPKKIGYSFGVDLGGQIVPQVVSKCINAVNTILDERVLLHRWFAVQLAGDFVRHLGREGFAERQHTFPLMLQK
jgi:hypothetical protein